MPSIFFRNLGVMPSGRNGMWTRRDHLRAARFNFIAALVSCGILYLGDMLVRPKVQRVTLGVDRTLVAGQHVGLASPESLFAPVWPGVASVCFILAAPTAPGLPAWPIGRDGRYVEPLVSMERTSGITDTLPRRYYRGDGLMCLEWYPGSVQLPPYSAVHVWSPITFTATRVEWMSSGPGLAQTPGAVVSMVGGLFLLVALIAALRRLLLAAASASR